MRLRRLEELAARKVARSMSFEEIESTYKAIEMRKMPEYLVLMILKQTFPESEKDICLYRYFYIKIFKLLKLKF